MLESAQDSSPLRFAAVIGSGHEDKRLVCDGPALYAAPVRRCPPRGAPFFVHGVRSLAPHCAFRGCLSHATRTGSWQMRGHRIARGVPDKPFAPYFENA